VTFARLVAASDDATHPPSGGLRAHLLGESRLPAPGLPAEQDESTAAVERGIDVQTQRGPFVVAVDEPAAAFEHRRAARRIRTARSFDQSPPFTESLEPEQPSVDVGPIAIAARDGLRGFREQHLPAPGLGRDACCGIDGRAVQIAALFDHRARVQAHADADRLAGIARVVLVEGVDDVERARDPRGRVGEGHHEPVPHRLDLAAAVPAHDVAHDLLVRAEQIHRDLVTLRLGVRGRALHIRDEDGRNLGHPASAQVVTVERSHRESHVRTRAGEGVRGSSRWKATVGRESTRRACDPAI
jgi:hypothetical protein